MDEIIYDLSSLKFGFAQLQHYTYELASREKLELKQLQKGTRFDALEAAINKVASSQHPCGDHGWVQVVDFDMALLKTSCPEGWTQSQLSKRSCGRTNLEQETCSKASFEFEQGTLDFVKVCGRVKAYALGGVDGFENFDDGLTEIEEAYVTGVSLTVGDPPNMEHLWTFAAGISETGRSSSPGEDQDDQCPCDVDDITFITIPPFVGNNYFCESGHNAEYDGTDIFQADDPLWDGENCIDESNCCEFNRPPYFVNDLGKVLTASKIDARICLNDDGPDSVGDDGEDIFVEVVELYVMPAPYK